MAKLVIFDENVRGLELPEQGVVVGRSQSVDVPLDDRLLSRKHCAILPRGAAFTLVDLKSANGTYVNGQRVEWVGLEFDDVVELGSTVMVFLYSEVWNRGEGLTRLRNPVKAQELVQRLNRQAGERSRSQTSSVAHIPFVTPQSSAAEMGNTETGIAETEIVQTRTPEMGPAATTLATWLRGTSSNAPEALSAESLELLVSRLESIVSRALGLLAPDLGRVVASEVHRILSASSGGALSSSREPQTNCQEQTGRAVREALRQEFGAPVRSILDGTKGTVARSPATGKRGGDE